MMKLLVPWLSFLAHLAWTQSYTVSSVFSHNDYAQTNPFQGAYSLQVGYIEADVYLVDNQLLVAHFQNEIQKEKTLEVLYLIPLQQEIIKNSGRAYTDSTLRLKLMIDLKTEGTSTLSKLVSQLQSYSEIINCRGLEVFVSGSVPPPDQWNSFPSFIHFDGRPGVIYTDDQLARITIISTSFRDHSKWDGKGEIPKKDKAKLEQVINSAHAIEKKIRFWATPDSENGWSTLMKLSVDVIATDRVAQLVEFLKK